MRALEDAGFAVEPAAPGCAYFETRGVERLYGGLEPALQAGARRRSAPAGTRAWAPPTRKFAALAAANVARAGQALVVSRRADAGVPRAAAARRSCRSSASGTRS